MININQILEEAPAKISEFCTKENEAYAMMEARHEEYKRERAKEYFRQKIAGNCTAKDVEYKLDMDSGLCQIKDAELLAEVDYRAWRTRKEKAEHLFNAAVEMGRNQRAEMYSLNDTIMTKEKK